jgi:pimeloyl-ACP methyl ester carboxylesterase
MSLVVFLLFFEVSCLAPVFVYVSSLYRSGGELSFAFATDVVSVGSSARVVAYGDDFHHKLSFSFFFFRGLDLFLLEVSSDLFLVDYPLFSSSFVVRLESAGEVSSRTEHEMVDFVLDVRERKLAFVPRAVVLVRLSYGGSLTLFCF